MAIPNPNAPNPPACISQYYQSGIQIMFGRNNLTIVTVGTVHTLTATKPFLALVGLEGNTRASMASNQAFASSCQLLMENAYFASNNFVSGSALYPSFWADSPLSMQSYLAYLNKQLFGKPDQLARYNMQATHLTSFWNDIDLGNTAQEYYNQVETMFKYIQDNYNKLLFIPPGIYEFKSGAGSDTFGSQWADWKAANPALTGLEVIEIISI